MQGVRHESREWDILWESYDAARKREDAEKGNIFSPIADQIVSS